METTYDSTRSQKYKVNFCFFSKGSKARRVASFCSTAEKGNFDLKQQESYPDLTPLSTFYRLCVLGTCLFYAFVSFVGFMCYLVVFFND